MIKKFCPICGKEAASELVYEENLPKDIKEMDFSGRKNPDGYHYQMTRCKTCSLLYASEIYEKEFSNKLYNESSFDYIEELNGLKKTYRKCLIEASKNIIEKKNFLEIGCGNGFMLNEALDIGFKKVIGIEPSKNAIELAPLNIKDKIIHGVFDKSKFENNSFDIVFISMIIEHVVDINFFLLSIYEILKPGGRVVCICHNESHFLARMLKNKHPIINDEHVTIFSKNTLLKIFKKNLFKEIQIQELKNYYSAKYWIKMLPSPNILKKIFSFIFLSILKNITLGLKAGNLYLIAKK